MKLTVFLTVLLYAEVSFSQSAANYRNVETVFQWKVVPFALPPGTKPHPSYEKNDTFISGIIDSPDRYFLGTPRTLSFLPSTLSFVRKDETNISPPLQPYPNISWNRMPQCAEDCNSTLVSVFRTARDSCNRLWVLDSGIYYNSAVDVPGVKACPPKIVIFDLDKDVPVRVIVIPESVLTRSSLLLNIILDYNCDNPIGNEEACDEVFVYIADGISPAIIVMEYPTNKFYRISHPSMYPHPDFGTVTIEGVTYTNMVGINGMTIATNKKGERRLFYQPFASITIYSISTAILQAGPFREDASQLNVSVAFTKKSQGLALCTDFSDGNILFNPVKENSIISGNPTTKTQTLLAQNYQLIKVQHDCSQDIFSKNIIYFVGSRFQLHVVRAVNAKEINFWVIKLTRKIHA